MAGEKNFENRVKKFLDSQGIYALGTPESEMTITPSGFWEKRWGGGMYSKSGLPDMHVVVNGINIEVELKKEGGKPSELQIQKLQQIEKSGSYAILLYPFDFELFKGFIQSLKDGFIKNAEYCYEELHKQLEKYTEKKVTK